jgi:hypothetical protein
VRAPSRRNGIAGCLLNLDLAVDRIQVLPALAFVHHLVLDPRHPIGEHRALLDVEREVVLLDRDDRIVRSVLKVHRLVACYFGFHEGLLCACLGFEPGWLS